MNWEAFGYKLEDCDLCGDVFGIMQVEFNGVQFLCARCREDQKKRVEHWKRMAPVSRCGCGVEWTSL